MLPEFPEFKLVGLEDRVRLSRLIARYPSNACEINFGNIFIWRHFDHPKFTAINGNLCILCEPPSEPAYFLQPIGESRLRETVDTCLSFAPRLSRVPESFAVRYASGLRSEPDPNNFDYVYLSEDLISLKGKKYDGKRNRIRKFERNHVFRYLRMSPAHLDGCRELFEKWLGSKASSQGSFLSMWRDVIHEALLFFEELGLCGGVVEMEGRIAALSIGERLTADTAVIHIEICDPAFDGLPQLINREFVRAEWAGFRFINREQDMGLAGLRRAKMSYYPHHLVKKFNIWGRG
jgi:hypothetical protein